MVTEHTISIEKENISCESWRQVHVHTNIIRIGKLHEKSSNLKYTDPYPLPDLDKLKWPPKLLSLANLQHKWWPFDGVDLLETSNSKNSQA